VQPDGDGWDELEVSFHDLGWYADYLASFGADVIAVDPPDLREAVIRRLKGVPQ
jgi:proteasome accessory factor B